MVIGALFLAASLTPSLIPRSFLLQGVLAGACFAIGYGVGAALLRLWAYLAAADRRPAPAPQRHLGRGRARRAPSWSPSPGARPEWQNSIRERVDMPPVHTGHPLEVMAIAAVVVARPDPARPGVPLGGAPGPALARPPRPRADLEGRRPRRRGPPLLGHRRRRAAARLPQRRRRALRHPRRAARARVSGAHRPARHRQRRVAGRLGGARPGRARVRRLRPDRRGDHRLHRPPGGAAAPGLRRPELGRRPSRTARSSRSTR